MHVEGSCHCGRIRYEAEVDPAKVVICHCTDCQTRSGSAFRTVAQTEPGTFKILAGTPKNYVKIAESGNERVQAFCGDCGSPLFAGKPDDNTSAVSLRVGSIKQRDQLIPRDQFWSRSSQAWLRELGTIHARETQPVFSAKGTFVNPR